MENRYSRQIAFPPIGPEGQKKLGNIRVAVIGLGALGSSSANMLARAGIGFLRIIDRDYVEKSNLQRQVLYTEADAAEDTPKAIAAAEKLASFNSEITIEPIIADVNSGNIDGLIGDVDLIVDATDNMEIRRLLNEACHHLKKPWIFGGVAGSYGMTMNFTGGDDDPCLSCLFEDDSLSIAAGETCATAGILNMLTNTMASIQCAEAVKILIGADTVRKELLYFDMWFNEIDTVKVSKSPDCPVCAHEQYSVYGKPPVTQAVSLCGRNSVQIAPADTVAIDFEEYAEKLGKLGDVKIGKFTLDFDDGKIGIKLFKDGRAVIKNVTDEKKARAVYSEYIGL